MDRIGFEEFDGAVAGLGQVKGLDGMIGNVKG